MIFFFSLFRWVFLICPKSTHYYRETFNVRNFCATLNEIKCIRENWISSWWTFLLFFTHINTRTRHWIQIRWNVKLNSQSKYSKFVNVAVFLIYISLHGLTLSSILHTKHVCTRTTATLTRMPLNRTRYFSLHITHSRSLLSMEHFLIRIYTTEHHIRSPRTMGHWILLRWKFLSNNIHCLVSF